MSATDRAVTIFFFAASSRYGNGSSAKTSNTFFCHEGTQRTQSQDLMLFSLRSMQCNPSILLVFARIFQIPSDLLSIISTQGRKDAKEKQRHRQFKRQIFAVLYRRTLHFCQNFSFSPFLLRDLRLLLFKFLGGGIIRVASLRLGVFALNSFWLRLRRAVFFCGNVIFGCGSAAL
jgi:hypothetical protein